MASNFYVMISNWYDERFSSQLPKLRVGMAKIIS
jgi:hypothetical protein